MSLHLVIGNKNYSSWSFRPWLAMKVAGITFDETVGSLDAADFKTRVTALGGAGRVPVLRDGDVRVRESLAILEYLAEKFPAAGLWPERPAARAHARAIGARIDAFWGECLSNFGGGGHFLFGAFGAADAMFAPVVWRFHTYAVEVSSTALTYMRTMMVLPSWTEWRDAARRETWVLAEDEVDWPQVLRE